MAFHSENFTSCSKSSVTCHDGEKASNIWREREREKGELVLEWWRVQKRRKPQKVEIKQKSSKTFLQCYQIS